MTQANLLEGVKISGNRPQTYKIELKKTYLFGTNHLNSSVWYNPIPKVSTARKIFRRALATDFQGNQVNLLFDTILAHIAPHCTHKVANISQCSPIAGLYSSCRIVAPVVGLLACTCSCSYTPNHVFLRQHSRKRWVLQSLCCIRSFASITSSSNRVVVSDRDGDLVHRQHLNWKNSRIIRELEIVVTFGRRSGLAATIPTLILITESCLLLLPPTSPQRNKTDQFFLSAFHLESIHKFSIFFKPCSTCLTQRMYGVEENFMKLACSLTLVASMVPAESERGEAAPKKRKQAPNHMKSKTHKSSAPRIIQTTGDKNHIDPKVELLALFFANQQYSSQENTINKGTTMIPTRHQPAFLPNKTLQNYWHYTKKRLATSLRELDDNTTTLSKTPNF